MDREPTKQAEITCFLPPAEATYRADELRRDLLANVIDVRVLADGYAFAFPVTPGIAARISAFADAERECCPSLLVETHVGATRRRIWLELSGPAGTREFLQRNLGNT